MSNAVLIVDDDRLFSRRLASMVSTLGYDVTTAFSPEEAVAQVRQRPFDVVLVDLFFEGVMCGTDLMERLKQEPNAHESAFIVLTAFGSIQTALDAVKRGADNYLAKGASGMVNIDQLSLAMSEALERKRLEREHRISSRIFESLHRLSVHFAHTSPDTLLTHICEQIAEVLEADLVVLAAPGPTGQPIHLRTAIPPRKEILSDAILFSCIHDHVIVPGAPMQCTPSSAPVNCLHCFQLFPALAVLHAVPIRTDSGAVIGALLAGAHSPARTQRYFQRLLEIFAQRIGAELLREHYLFERQQLYEHLSQSQKMDAIGSLAAGIAHEFNNILCVISNSAEVLARAISNSIATPALQSIEQAVSRGADLVRKLTDTVRVEVSELTSVSLREVVHNVLAMCHGTFAGIIDVQTDLSDDTPPVRGSIRQLEHVLLNLCLNARDAMPQGGVLRIATSRADIADNDSLVFTKRLAPGPHALLSVSDTGCGMDSDTMAHIFDPFFTRKPVGQGRGLGLTMVYNTVTLLNGAVTVESSPGHGSTFRIYLPAWLPSPSVGSPSDVPHVPRLRRVLVVDDDASLRATLKLLLEQHGYSAETAADGFEACEKARSGSTFDLILLDMTMPRMNGYETFKRLKEINPQIRVVIISGYSQSREVCEMLETGALGFIAKPFRIKDLLASIEAALATAPHPSS
ncbi:MAG: response regulator [bacterium]|nr:response regulator [bacterium]